MSIRALARWQSMVWAVEEARLRQMATALIMLHGAACVVFADGATPPMSFRGHRPHAWEEDVTASDTGKKSVAPYTLRGDIAVIGVGGTIHKYASQVNTVSGGRGTSVERLRTSFAAARADSRVRSVLLMVDSPGGSVDGVETFAQELAKARAEGFPVYAYADDLMASAAYWIGSQARELWAGPTTAVGSIGVYTVLADTTKWYEKQGVTVHVVKAGKNKAIGVDGVPLTAEDLAKVSDEVQAYYTAFKTAVVRGRPALKSTIEDVADGLVHIGEDARTLGLVDRVGSVEAMLAHITKDTRQAARPSASVVSPSGSPAAYARRTGGAARPHTGNARSTVMKRTGLTGAALLLAAAAGGVTAGVPPIPPMPTGDGEDGGDVGAEDQRQVVITNAELQKMISSAARQGAAEATATVQKTLEARDKAAREADASRVAAVRRKAEAYKHVAGVTEAMNAALADSSVSAEAFGDKVAELLYKNAAPLAAISVGADGGEKFRSSASLGVVVGSCPTISRALGEGGSRADMVAEALGFKSSAEARAAVRAVQGDGLAGVRAQDLIDRMWKSGGQAAAGVGMTEAKYRASGSLTSSDFPLLLADVANKVQRATFQLYDVNYPKYCRIGTLNDFREKKLPQLSNAPRLLQVPESGTLQMARFAERSGAIKAKKYGLSVAWTWEMAKNNDLGTFAQLVELLTIMAKLEPNYQVVEMIKANTAYKGDNVAAFHANHYNLLTAGTLAMSEVQEAFVQIHEQRDFDKNKTPVTRKPGGMLVPPALYPTALQIFKSERDWTAAGNGDKPVNAMAGMFPPINEPLLNYAPNASAQAYFFFADPVTNPAIEVAFLDGRQEPYVNPISDGSMLNVEYELVCAFGVDWVEPEAMLKNAGG